MTKIIINESRLEQFSPIERKIYEFYLETIGFKGKSFPFWEPDTERHFRIGDCLFPFREGHPCRKNYTPNCVPEEIKEKIRDAIQKARSLPLRVLLLPTFTSSQYQLCFLKDFFGDNIWTIKVSHRIPYTENFKYVKDFHKIDEWIVSTQEFLPLDLTDSIDFILPSYPKRCYNPIFNLREIARILSPGSSCLINSYFTPEWLLDVSKEKLQELEQLIIKAGLDDPFYISPRVGNTGPNGNAVWRYIAKYITDDYHNNFRCYKEGIEEMYGVRISETYANVFGQTVPSVHTIKVEKIRPFIKSSVSKSP